jgi:DNA adenine methylase
MIKTLKNYPGNKSIEGLYQWIYYNYPKPQVLHTYKYVGNDCWDRQRIKRKIERLTNKLIELPELERNAVISRITKELSTF